MEKQLTWGQFDLPTHYGIYQKNRQKGIYTSRLRVKYFKTYEIQNTNTVSEPAIYASYTTTHFVFILKALQLNLV